MKLLIGLGNPGDTYRLTRHNVGRMALEILAEKFTFPAFQMEKKFFGKISCGQIGNEKTILLEPETFMNLSGKSAQAVMNFYKLKPSDLIIFSDDADLKFGTIRLRERGSSGGHNGLKSIIQMIGSEEFSRIKIGIANDKRTMVPAEDFVLQKFSAEEQKALPKILGEAIQKFLEKNESPNS